MHSHASSAVGAGVLDAAAVVDAVEGARVVVAAVVIVGAAVVVVVGAAVTGAAVIGAAVVGTVGALVGAEVPTVVTGGNGVVV